MAASYWDSTQYKDWTFSRAKLASIRKGFEDAAPQTVAAYPLPDRRLLHLYFWHQLAKIGKNTAPGNRQQILATAQVLIRRFYLKVDIRETNPFAVLTTAFYLASKIEECPIHLRQIYNEARQTWPDVMVSSTARLAEYEFAMISQLRSQLIIHHPYRTLLDLKDEFDLAQEELTVAWCIVNDHYVTDLPFLYPPYVLAFTSVILSLVITLTGNVNLPPGSANSAASSVPSPFTQTGPALGAGQMASPSVSGVPAASATPMSTGHCGTRIDRSRFSSVLLPLQNGLVSMNLPKRVEQILQSIGSSEINLQDVIECAQEFVALYQMWDLYRESECREMLVRLVRGREMDK